MSLRRILVPIDFSEESRAAVATAARLARRHDATLTLMHVDHVPPFGERLVARAPADVGEEYLRQRAAAAQRLLEETAAKIEGVKVQIVVGRDEVARAIVERAARDQDDAIVVGAHGSASSGHSWIGSVAFDVAAHASCPVLIARDGRAMDADGFRRPLVAIGLDRPVEPAIALVDDLCGETAPIALLHVYETPSNVGKPAVPSGMLDAQQHARARRADRLDADVGKHRLGRVALHFDEAESASDAIFSRVDREGHDVVVVGQRAQTSRTGGLGSVARRLLEHGHVSVAVLPASD